MSENIFASGVTSTDERNERARRAVKNFRAMQFTLTGYARAITGRKDISVELATGTPRTDGKKIYIKPPMALGDNVPHQRMYCDKRDPETLEQLCPSCAAREDVLIKVIHEIAHNAFGTFEKTNPKAVADAMDRAIREVGTKYAKSISEVWDKIPDYKKQDYLNLSGLISPFLPILVNALEDARVDEAMFTVRKGTRAMFDALMLKIFREGIEEDDGSFSQWSDRPLNSQALIGVFVLCCGYKYDGWFSPEVEEALGDDQLRLLCSQIDTIRSAEGTYNLAFPILARLRELGFCRSEQDPEDEEPDTQENEEDESSEDSDEASEEEQDGDPGDDDSGTDEPGDDESTGGSGDPDYDMEAESDSEGSGGSGPDDEGEGGDPGEAGSGAGDPDDEAVENAAEDGEGSDGSPGQPDEDGDRSGDDGSEGGAEVPEGSDIGGDDWSDADEGEGSDGEDGEAGPGEGSPPGEASEGEGVPGDGEHDATGDGEGSLDEGGDSTDTEPSGSPWDSSDQSDPGADDDGGRPDDSDGESEDSDLGDAGMGSPLDWQGDDGPGEGDPEGLEDGRLDEDSDERVDTLADDGMGGDKLDSNPTYGDADQAFEDVFVFNKHEVYHGEPEEKTADEKADDKALDMAIMQGGYFETPSVNVAGVREHAYADRKNDLTADAWNNYDDEFYKKYLTVLGGDSDLSVEESALAPALREMRRVFADNKRSHYDRNRKDGKVNGKVLGKRAPFGDPRLFQKKRVPGKRDYAVILGLDVSGSTVGENLHLIKRAAKAQAELLYRMGIDFAVYAHSGSGGWGVDDLMLDIYCIKDFEDPWDSPHQEALDHLCADAQNLDGHTLEFYRRRIERVQATDKVIMYYTDGKMPAENHDEELQILQREIKYCRSRGIHLMGVGIRTDSPVRHGLPTVQVDDDADLVKVIRHLETGLLRHR